ncbi:type II toxin-antitoxin system HicA family toxin [Methanoculleus bourgensis]|jgi:predicted RNA binding protein YcfA (HicA-like mRNA interferase family)|uniref:type II toxin-antitoxin system HicA family toxin n=1 Tax=Methanoculleus bourgensis TaxID=83986 RepID=UPI003B935AAD
MGKLPIISGREAVKAFSKVGWRVARQTGSHVIMLNHSSPALLSIPDHAELKRGTLRNLITDASMTVDEFLALI